MMRISYDKECVCAYEQQEYSALSIARRSRAGEFQVLLEPKVDVRKAAALLDGRANTTRQVKCTMDADSRTKQTAYRMSHQHRSGTSWLSDRHITWI